MFAALTVIMRWLGVLVYDAVDMRIQIRDSVNHDDFVLNEDETLIRSSDLQNNAWKLNNHHRQSRSLSSVIEPEDINAKEDSDHFYNSLTANENLVDDQIFKKINSVKVKNYSGAQIKSSYYSGLKGYDEYKVSRSGPLNEIQPVQPEVQLFE